MNQAFFEFDVIGPQFTDQTESIGIGPDIVQRKSQTVLPEAVANALQLRDIGVSAGLHSFHCDVAGRQAGFTECLQHVPQAIFRPVHCGRHEVDEKHTVVVWLGGRRANRELPRVRVKSGHIVSGGGRGHDFATLAPGTAGEPKQTLVTHSLPRGGIHHGLKPDGERVRSQGFLKPRSLKDRPPGFKTGGDGKFMRKFQSFHHTDRFAFRAGERIAQHSDDALRRNINVRFGVRTRTAARTGTALDDDHIALGMTGDPVAGQCVDHKALHGRRVGNQSQRSIHTFLSAGGRRCYMGITSRLGRLSCKECPRPAPSLPKTMNLCQLFDLSLRGRQDAIGLEFRGVEYSFGEIDARSNRLAQLLLQRGFVPGDRLCVYLANCLDMIDLFLACVKTGVIFVPINILYRGREISHILGDAAPRAVVSETTLDCAIPVWSPGEMTRASADLSDRRPAVAVDGDAPAGIIYTSGTTGTSKGAVLTHHNFAINATNLVACWSITAADRFLLALPLFHVHGLANGIHSWLVSGCRMRLLERFDQRTAAAEFLGFRPTLFFGVPTIYVRLLDFDPDTARRIGEAARLFVSGSAPLPAEVLRDFETLYGHRILERYGMSETLMNMSNPHAGDRRAGTVGLPLPGVSVRLLNAAGEAVAEGETGQIHLRGPNVFAGYWGRGEATRDAFADGWFRTGDLATRSPDGYYTLCGRQSDLIISGGFNIYPREIEEFLQEQPEIAEAAVKGVADRARGEVPVAYVVALPEFDAVAMEERCRAALASFKVPRRFVVVDCLPRNALGKVQKHLLPQAN
jgi:malonyl-CoA/methylmalonyl-CoA synthetase